MTSQKKNCAGSGLNDVLFVAIAIAITTGTALTEASAATTARRGGVGTTTVNSSVHTATQESPSQRVFMLSRSGGSPSVLSRALDVRRLFSGRKNVSPVAGAGMLSEMPPRIIFKRGRTPF